MPETIHTHFNKTDESFNSALPERYDLALQFSEKEVSYSLFEPERNKFIAAGTFRTPIDEFMDSTPWLKGAFHSTRIIIENNKSTLFPSVFFDPDEKEKYLSFIVEQDGSDLVYFDNMVSLDIISVYSVPGSLTEKLGKYFPGSRIRHISTALIESVWVNYKNLIQGKRVFINVRIDNFDLLVFDGNQLSYFNSFPFQTPEDLAYYVIFVFEQMNLNPEEVGVTLFGKVEKNSPVFDLLFKYIRNIEMGVRNETFTFSYVFRDVPGHSLYTLLNPGS